MAMMTLWVGKKSRPAGSPSFLVITFWECIVFIRGWRIFSGIESRDPRRHHPPWQNNNHQPWTQAACILIQVSNSHSSFLRQLYMYASTTLESSTCTSLKQLLGSEFCMVWKSRGFLSLEECEHLKDISRNRLHRSGVVDSKTVWGTLHDIFPFSPLREGKKGF